ncbi:M48 family peptidase, partial [Curtobacterium sp. MCSS17_011]|uniref:SprT-like domain-containing protein n=1 Tax=Curtobacterium sp. MCSS17_011 TaxID=2175643 RepID=UPI000D85F6F5
MTTLETVRLRAEALIAEHLGAGTWAFGFDHAKTRAGQCDFARKRITVSRHLATRFSDDDVEQVLLHEV